MKYSDLAILLVGGFSYTACGQNILKERHPSTLTSKNNRQWMYQK